jgi:hypothetical protein
MRARLEILAKAVAVTIRGLLRDPGFSLVSVVLLALGIGLTSAVFTLISACPFLA